MSVLSSFSEKSKEDIDSLNIHGQLVPSILPHQKMYKIQLGSQLFTVSGASLSSDGPSYFTEYFTKNKDTSDEVLFIDRSAEVFQMVYQHLQGYAIPIKDEIQYTMLLSDAMSYHLPRLISILRETEYFYTNVGGKTFKFPKKLFGRKGDSPNYFHMTAGSSNIDMEKFVMLSKRQLRPPPQNPPYISRSPYYFEDLLNLLNGASFKMDEEKRRSLLKECRYYMFLNLEQKLIKANIIFNPFTQSEDIEIELVDLNKKNVVPPINSDRTNTVNIKCEADSDSDSISPEDESSYIEPPSKKQKSHSCDKMRKKITHCWDMLGYKRPYLDDYARDLMFQINLSDCTLVINTEKKVIHLSLTGGSASKFENVFADSLQKAGFNLNDHKLKLPIDEKRQSKQLVLPACLYICDLTVNGSDCSCISSLISDVTNDSCTLKSINAGSVKLEKVIDFTNLNQLSCSAGIKLHCRKSIWKIGVRNGNIMMIGVKADTYNGNKEYCKAVKYL